MIFDGQKNAEIGPSQTTPEHKPFHERVSRLRTNVVNAIREGRTLSLPQFNANGDDLLIRAACWEVLFRLCDEEGLDPHTIRLSAEQNDEEQSLHVSTLGIFSWGTATGALDSKRIVHATLYQESLYEFSSAMGVKIDPLVYDTAPKIWPTDKGPLKNIDVDAIRKKTVELRAMLGSRSMIVIGQAGSAAEKRFTDAQLVEVAAAIRQKHPDAYIVVLSDKHFLRSDLSKLEQMQKAAPFPVHTSGSSKFTAEHIAHFYNELATPLMAGDGNAIDQVQEITDINELLAYLGTADEAAMTDGYWMHLASSLEIPKVVALFTMFKAEKWASPATIVVNSDAMENEKRDFISSQFYHLHSAYENNHHPDNYGIEENDVQKYITALTQM